MIKTFKPEDLPENDKVLLAKDGEGWRTVYPIKNEDGSFNWYNFVTGGKGYKHFAWKVIMILVVTGIIYMGLQELIGNYKLIANNPCDFCKSCLDAITPKFNAYG